MFFKPGDKDPEPVRTAFLAPGTPAVRTAFLAAGVQTGMMVKGILEVGDEEINVLTELLEGQGIEFHTQTIADCARNADALHALIYNSVTRIHGAQLGALYSLGYQVTITCSKDGFNRNKKAFFPEWNLILRAYVEGRDCFSLEMEEQLRDISMRAAATSDDELDDDVVEDIQDMLWNLKGYLE